MCDCGKVYKIQSGNNSPNLSIKHNNTNNNNEETKTDTPYVVALLNNNNDKETCFRY